MLQETQDNEEIIERVAALDIGKRKLVCCVRVPSENKPGGHGGNQRLPEAGVLPAGGG